ncbi:hypothetical protein VC83_00018 [Pseudogymnoascus destructans]|uniref:Uncharacterized protein n=1 Tax=Pseudogymnoascus destructans TaxID=655981 RepID=A0A177ALG6_9PEZI|nr:uncharacterized protein VC83_00018 [Pseudogymnoascus destructans]OAF62875.1 hypothetical protein VC83_00018 [Pseudogymnoascus destructans]
MERRDRRPPNHVSVDVTEETGRSVICLLDEGLRQTRPATKQSLPVKLVIEALLCPSATDQKICPPKPTNCFFYVFYSSKNTQVSTNKVSLQESPINIIS